MAIGYFSKILPISDGRVAVLLILNAAEFGGGDLDKEIGYDALR